MAKKKPKKSRFVYDASDIPFVVIESTPKDPKKLKP